MKSKWATMVSKVDAMSIRERVLIFAALAFGLVSVINTFLLDPLLAEQRSMSSKMQQQQEKMKEIQAQLDGLLEAKRADEFAPQRQRILEIKDGLARGDVYLKETQDKLVSPDRMAHLLEQVLGKNIHLQLVGLETLPVSLLIEPAVTDDKVVEVVDGQDRQIYKHGVRMTVRGSYVDILQYLNALEALPTQMFWGMATMKVVQYPNAELTLTLYTLSLDKTWLQV
ncbi:MAG: agglutinin biogenesis protein [Sideroxydans sp.]|nr:agglutinin biogenesis protein [Sideroxydans sp.]